MGIEDFFTKISGESVELNGFLDLSGMAAATGHKLTSQKFDSLRGAGCRNGSQQECIHWR